MTTSSTPIFNDLSDHTFIKSILNDSTPLMKARHEGKTEYTEQQRYHFITGEYAGQALSQLERIEQASILLNSYPYIRAWRQHYGQFQYFQYHLEAYYLGVAGLVDRILLLINQLCRLGLDDKNAKMSPITKELKSKGHLELLAALESLKNGTEAVKKIRNDVVHAQRFHEKDLWHIALLEFSLREKTVPDTDGYLKSDLEFFTKIYRKKKNEQLHESNIAIALLIDKLFTTLDELYQQERTR